MDYILLFIGVIFAGIIIYLILSHGFRFHRHHRNHRKRNKVYRCNAAKIWVGTRGDGDGGSGDFTSDFRVIEGDAFTKVLTKSHRPEDYRKLILIKPKTDFAKVVFTRKHDSPIPNLYWKPIIILLYRQKGRKCFTMNFK